MPQLHLQQLLHLVEVARSPTWTEAARRLHLSQSALSQSLAEMERRLSVRLFERAGRRRPLTPEGEELLRFAQRTVAEAREVASRLAAGSAAGRLRIGMIDAVSLYVLPQVLRRHRRLHPGLELALRVGPSRELLRALEEFELDVAIVVGPIERAALSGQLLIEEPLYMYSPRAERGAAAAAEWALYPTGSQTRARIDAALAAQNIRPRVVLESGSPEVLRQMVRLGFCWSVLPQAVAAGSRELKRRGRGALTTRSLLLVTRRSSAGDPRVEEFRAVAQRRARGEG
jgi:DNA-binding transcriptional LysR family regulator